MRVLRARGVQPETQAGAAGILPLLALLGLLIVDLTPAEASVQRSWQDLLVHASEGSRTPHSGEILWITWSGEASKVGVADVISTGEDFRLHGPSGRRLHLSPDGGQLVDPNRGTAAALPPLRPALLSPEALADKYEIEVVGAEPLLERPATMLEMRRRDGGVLRERLWLDDESGLLLRRESYDGETLLRLFAYLSLTLDTTVPEGPMTNRGGAPNLQRLALRSGGAEEEAALIRLATLRADGFAAPKRLPGGYQADSIFHGARDRQPLHLVYGDGLYTVSLFQQRGRIDWNRLPAGGQPVKAFGGRSRLWPDAVPTRMVWEAEGITYTLVGDAPPDEFLAIARALPQAEPDHPLQRLLKGLSRLWSWVSPWT